MTKREISAVAQAEEAQLKRWAQDKVFERSVEQRAGQPAYVFYDGPPFANGLPHLGHMMTSTLKDAIMRYQTMRGKYAPRRFGWDCHGLPPELLAEKELGISGKIAIQEYGIEKFVQYCADSVLRFTGEWHEYVVRVGRWVDFKHDYRTMDTDYMESVIWAFKQLHEKGLVYEGERVVPYSYGAQTALSNSETRLDDSMRDREDLTATVKFRLHDGRYLLGWTTTPWTLPANLLLAVNEKMDYVEYKLGDEVLIIGLEALDRYAEQLSGASEQKRFRGTELVGLSYEPLFTYFVGSENSFQVVAGEFVTEGEGTGVVHIAPGHGEDDYWLGKRIGTPIVSPVDDDGRFTADVKDYVGRLVFDANGEIIADLERQHKLFVSQTILHKYPHCWRTDVPIIYRALSAWFVDVPKIKDQLLEANRQINWYPAHVKDGAFGKWLENAREWNVSRKRFWGAPIPVWKTEDGEVLIVGSLQEIKDRAVDPAKVVDLHRPHIDQVELKTDSGKIARRVEDVFDCWFESGSMPFAQMHYPFENKEQFESGHPSDFITEYIGQTRGWFYTLHVMSVALFGKPAFKNAIAHGILLGSDGRKLSKRLGNYPDNNEVFDTAGADAVRYYLLGSALGIGETAIYDPAALVEIQRNVIARLKNVLGFYTMYASVDSFVPKAYAAIPSSDHVLDRWVLSRLSETVNLVAESVDGFDTPRAMREITNFLDDLSNWYVRRSRRRFWKSGDDSDKLAAYETLHFVLATTAQVIAPWAPFVADEVWQGIMSGVSDVPESVHLSDWPTLPAPQESLLKSMQQLREVVTEGLSQRAQAGIKVRQPLAKVEITGMTLGADMRAIVSEELNVKKVECHKGASLSVALDLTLTEELKQEGLVRDVIRQIQEARKQAQLAVDNRIHLSLQSEDAQMRAAIKAYKKDIQAETLATKIDDSSRYDFVTSTKLNGVELTITLKLMD